MQLRIKNINQGMKCRCPQSIVHKVEIGHLYRKATKTLLDWKRAGLAQFEGIPSIARIVPTRCCKKRAKS